MSPGDEREPPLKLDIYASPFIPQSLKSINEVPANIVTCVSPPWFNVGSYVQSFAGSSFLSAGDRPPLPQLVHSTDPEQILAPNGAAAESKNGHSVHGGHDDHLSKPSLLDEQNYHDYFVNALDQERLALRHECEAHNLYKVPLAAAILSRDPRPFMYRLYLNTPPEVHG